MESEDLDSSLGCAIVNMDLTAFASLPPALWSILSIKHVSYLGLSLVTHLNSAHHHQFVSWQNLWKKTQ